AALAAVSGSLEESNVTGETVRGIIAASGLDALLEKLRGQHARLISVTPIHGTLEDYFVAHTSEHQEAAQP
ncbi:MAG TPA: hypothetical protein VJ723_06705, partial [Candidatus Angelobacter sp.]|nr:hypothetical protein [Candidatus Angelobacter sp.]